MEMGGGEAKEKEDFRAATLHIPEFSVALSMVLASAKAM